MSTDAIEVGEEALDVKLNALKIVDENTAVATDAKPIKKGRYVRLTDEELRKQWEEIQATKKVIETGVKGTVKWYSILGHYGFIARSDKEGDIFVHQSAITISRIEKLFLRTLMDGEEVEFDIVEGKNGLEAANVSGPERTPVKGAKAFRILLGNRFNHKNSANKEEGDGSKAVKNGRRQRKPLADKNGQSEQESAAGDDSRPNSHRRARRPRQFIKKVKKIDDEEEIEEASSRRNSDENVPLTSSRCDADLGNESASLGATAVDAQI